MQWSSNSQEDQEAEPISAECRIEAMSKELTRLNRRPRRRNKKPRAILNNRRNPYYSFACAYPGGCINKMQGLSKAAVTTANQVFTTWLCPEHRKDHDSKISNDECTAIEFAAKIYRAASLVCAEPDCRNACHKLFGCCGFNICRNQRSLSRNFLWLCPEHRKNSSGAIYAQQPSDHSKTSSLIEDTQKSLEHKEISSEMEDTQEPKEGAVPLRIRNISDTLENKLWSESDADTDSSIDTCRDPLKDLKLTPEYVKRLEDWTPEDLKRLRRRLRREEMRSEEEKPKIGPKNNCSDPRYSLICTHPYGCANEFQGLSKSACKTANKASTAWLCPEHKQAHDKKMKKEKEKMENGENWKNWECRASMCNAKSRKITKNKLHWALWCAEPSCSSICHRNGCSGIPKNFSRSRVVFQWLCPKHEKTADGARYTFDSSKHIKTPGRVKDTRKTLEHEKTLSEKGKTQGPLEQTEGTVVHQTGCTTDSGPSTPKRNEGTGLHLPQAATFTEEIDPPSSAGASSHQ